MEYRRRRNRRTARGAYRSIQHTRASGGESSLFSILLLVLMAAALVYVFVATPVGAFIAEKLFKKSGSGEKVPDPVGFSTDAPISAEPLQTTAPENARMELGLPPLDLYALQLGMFDSASNAQGLISSLRSLGAAGYALASESGVRIIASCYSTEAAANSVCARLIEQGYAGVVYPIRCDGALLTVDGAQAQLDALKTCVDLAQSLIFRLNDETIRFDAEERSLEYGLAVANEMLGEVRGARAALSEMSEDSEAVALIEDHFIELTACFTHFASGAGDNRVELSGRLKHLQLEVIDRYCALTSKLQALTTG